MIGDEETSSRQSVPISTTTTTTNSSLHLLCSCILDWTWPWNSSKDASTRALIGKGTISTETASTQPLLAYLGTTNGRVPRIAISPPLDVISVVRVEELKSSQLPELKPLTIVSPALLNFS
ncbi:hypothetical protein L5515_011514 [Caenorhabditis briggsae]|uniref:Uncharacterized protein n=1 Tax=Caenorhabditis briggsae TaxID=6238 RepID=A0AAE9EWM4_CAEBR|nr:hypothetical protein L5515_011514 [Caenorhabditis briggsae]